VPGDDPEFRQTAAIAEQLRGDSPAAQPDSRRGRALQRTAGGVRAADPAVGADGPTALEGNGIRATGPGSGQHRRAAHTGRQGRGADHRAGAELPDHCGPLSAEEEDRMFPAARISDPITHDLSVPCGAIAPPPSGPAPTPTLIEFLPAAHV